MSKSECNKSYMRHKMALDAAISPKGDVKVAEIFKRKPYSCTNYTVPEETNEEEPDGDV